jgi:uncharacterized protein YbjT (DUF2867 family)
MTVGEVSDPAPRAAAPGATPLEGPIVVTGGSGQVGTALRRRLAVFPNEVRTPARGDRLDEAMRDAVAVVHLAGTLRPERGHTIDEANLETVRRTVGALSGSSVERVLFLSSVGADVKSGNAYLRAKAEAEELLRGSGRDVVVFRCTHVFGPPSDPGPTVSALRADTRQTVWVLGDGAQRVAPVFREDVVDGIVAALDPRSYHGRFDLPGPEELAMDEFVRVVNVGTAVRLRHVPSRVARALAHAAPGLNPQLVDVMLSDNLGEQQRADRAFGLGRRGVSEVYRPTRALAA